MDFKPQRYDSITVKTSITTLVQPNKKRVYLKIRNTSSNTIYVGTDDKVKSSDGMAIPQNGELILENGFMHKGWLYAVTSSGTADVRVLELYGD